MFGIKRHTAIIKVFLSLFLLIHKNKQLIGVGACSTEWIFISSVCKCARLSFLPAQKEIYACSCACMFVSIHFFCTPRPVSIMSELPAQLTSPPAIAPGQDRAAKLTTAVIVSSFTLPVSLRTLVGC